MGYRACNSLYVAPAPLSAGGSSKMASKVRNRVRNVSPQFLQQCLGLLQVSRVKALGEPAVDRCQQRVGLSPLALLLPQAAQRGRRPQLPRLRLLAPSHRKGLLEAGLRLGRFWDGLA